MLHVCSNTQVQKGRTDTFPTESLSANFANEKKKHVSSLVRFRLIGLPKKLVEKLDRLSSNQRSNTVSI